MTGELLREAAALMRTRAERASFANGSAWISYAMPDVGPNRWTMTGVGVPDDDQGHRIEAMFREDAEHIASWHPAVAFAVADWLDAAYEDERRFAAQGAHGFPGENPAFAVARAYLGRDVNEATAEGGS